LYVHYQAAYARNELPTSYDLLNAIRSVAHANVLHSICSVPERTLL
jgi:hypothetical protein